MMQDNKSDLELVCRELLNGFQEGLSWQWEDRFQVMLATFGVDNRDDIHTVLGRNLEITWDSSNIESASNAVSVINRNLGGLRSGQLLFSSDPSQDAFVFCAWWPWGNGETISIRLGPYYKKLLDSDKANQIQIFRSWFET
ncbi:MAG: hypothetical protein V3S33_05640 [Gammaproteobacteria bacterium]